jgi:hypothetical protein
VLSEYLYYSFGCARIIGKVGTTWSRGPLALGATVTVPSLRLPWSGGEVSVGRNLLVADTTLSGQIASSRQEDLDADYREPWSVALGAQFDAGSFEFHASAEWFGAVDEYDVLDTEPIESQVPPEEFLLPVTQRRESVFNVGGGIAVEATRWLSVYASARTDRSYRDPGDRSFVGLGAYDLTHVTAGVGVSNDNLEIILGGLFASGDADGQVTLSPLPGSPAVSTHTEFSQKGFVLAFSATF